MPVQPCKAWRSNELCQSNHALHGEATSYASPTMQCMEKQRAILVQPCKAWLARRSRYIHKIKHAYIQVNLCMRVLFYVHSSLLRLVLLGDIDVFLFVIGVYKWGFSKISKPISSSNADTTYKVSECNRN